jgi:flagellar hook-length control protein FliK
MGITVISASSTPVAATAGSAAATASASGGASTAGFAALLSGQIGNALGLSTGTTASTTAPTKALDEDEKAGQTEESATDPSLFLIGLPAAPIPVQNTHLPSLDTKIEESIGAIGEKGSGLSMLGDGGKTATTGLDAARLASTALGDGKGNELPQEAANIAADGQNASGNQNASLLAASGNLHKAASDTQVKNEIATPLHSANWAQDFSEKVVWLAKSDQQSAQININPPQLGPVQITLQINGDQASAVLASPHAEVRQALQDSLPQLKEMLAGAGINLGQADVGANFAQQNREAPFQAANGNRSSGENDILPGIGNTVESATSQPIQRGRGLVDLFA